MDGESKHCGPMGGHMGWSGVPLVPAPMAMFGAIMAFLVGVMIGVMVDKKRNMHGGPMMAGGPPWMRGKPPWMSGKAGTDMSHHHHGFGMPACCESHGEWPHPGKSGPESAEQPKAE